MDSADACGQQCRGAGSPGEDEPREGDGASNRMAATISERILGVAPQAEGCKIALNLMPCRAGG